MKTELLHSYSSNSLANLSRVCSKSNIAGGVASTEDNGSRRSYSSGSDDSGGAASASSEGSGKGQILKGISKGIFRKKLLYKKLPILKWGREYTGQKLIADIIAGLTVGLTILPQGLAYASIAHLPPQYGLYSAFMGPFLYILFGGSKVATIGPTAILAIVTLSYTSGKSVDYSILLCFLTGVVTFLMGIFNLGFIVNFISTPVISGFTSAAALTICSTQIKALFGLNFKADGFREIVYGTFQHFDEVHKQDAILASGCILVLLFMQHLQTMFKFLTKYSPKADRFLWFISTSRSVIVIVICTVTFSCIDPELFPVKVVGAITPGLPPIRLPPFTVYENTTGEVVKHSVFQLIREDASALIVLPLLALMEHITIVKKFPGTAALDASQEMIAIGLTNIFGAFFSSMPVTGSFSRSTVNAASGAESPLGGLITGLLVIMALEFLTPFFYFIPNACLAAVIVSAVIFTVDFSIVGQMWRSKRMDLIPWSFAFFASLLISLEVGILSGICISVTFLLYYAARPAVQIKRAETSLGNEFVIVALDRSLVFPSVEYIRYMVMKSRNTWAKGFLPVVIDCNHIQFADFSAAQGIRDLFTLFNEKSHPLILWRAKPSIIRVLSGLMESSGVPFQYCMREDELEGIIDAGEGDDDKPIEFCTSESPTANNNRMPTTVTIPHLERLRHS